MRLRIFRTYTWECLLPDSEIRIGGRNPLSLVPHDELQYLAYEDRNDPTYNVWRPVEVAEGPVPEHPHDKKDREEMEEFKRQLDKDLPRILEELKNKAEDQQ